MFLKTIKNAFECSIEERERDYEERERERSVLGSVKSETTVG
jgi:hypothetical protein